MTVSNRSQARAKRHRRVRKGVSGTTERPRLAVFRSNRHIVAQVIDDVAGRTLAAASSLEADFRSEGPANKDSATKVGKALAERAKAAGVEKVVFDRGGFRFHGSIAALAEAAREGGLDF